MKSSNKQYGARHYESRAKCSLTDLRKLLPHSVLDHEGRKVCLDGDVWQLNCLKNGAALNWSRYNELAAPELIAAAKLWVADAIERLGLSTPENRFRGLLACLTCSNISAVHVGWMTPIFFERLRESMRARGRGTYNQYTYARLFLYYCADNDLLGVSDQRVDEITNVEYAAHTGNPEAVMSWDPKHGPLVTSETDILDRCLGRLHTEDHYSICTMLSYELGCNPLSFCLLETRDLHIFKNAGITTYQLDVPRIKKRTRLRETCTRRPISDRLGESLAHLIFKHPAPPNHSAPLLRRATPRKHWLNGQRSAWANHLSPLDFSTYVSEFPKRAGIVSPRTGATLTLCPRRLRYSFAQRMAELGTPKRELAQLLDHTGLETVLVYYKNSSKVADRIEKSLSKTAGKIWRRFLGLDPIPRKETKFEVRAIGTNYRDLGGIGGCGRKLLCGLNPPYSCYQCAKFQPWLDGSHSEFLAEVRLEQKQLREFAQNNESYPIPSALSRVERAVSELVDRISKIRSLSR